MTFLFAFLTSSSVLAGINLSDNQIFGSLPTEIGFLGSMRKSESPVLFTMGVSKEKSFLISFSLLTL